MSKKIFWFDLTQNEQYRGTMIEGKRIGIVYEETNDNISLVKNEETTKQPIIPKPERLIGGTEVYQKPGIPYWYCRIKNGRDEFCHLYVKDLNTGDLLIDPKTGKRREFETPEEKEFVSNVLEAIRYKPKEGYIWIPVYESTLDEQEQLQFVPGKKPKTGLYTDEWEKLAERYSPENGSRMLRKRTYFLIALRWIKDGIATIDQVVKMSTEIGNYYDSENSSKNDFEETGKRHFGGICWGAGNTFKILKDFNSLFEYSIAGGAYFCYGKSNSMSKIEDVDSNQRYDHSLGLVELQK